MDTIPKRRIVLVDDNASFLRATEAFLRTLDAIELAGCATDGVEGLALISRLRPDAGIVDINMPGLNGFEVAARLRALPLPPAVILVSNNVDDATRREARRIGADAVLLKERLVGDLPALLAALPPARAFVADA